MDDTTVTGRGKRTAQLSTAAERTAAGDHRARLDPQLKAGIAEGWQASVTVPVIGGSASRATSGDVRLGLQGKFNDEAGWLPSLGASLRLDLPTGRDSEGLDTRFKLLATKTLAERHRVHLNALLENNQEPRPNERSNRRGLVVGYDVQLRGGTLLLADYVVEQARERGRHDRLLEAGLRQKVGEGVLGFGVGAGLRDSATDWRLRVSWQQEF
ncbi:hypothetical protein Rta_32630 [Ramlibacter tataouinensis TTB310]|uniref:Uncharacterized protein n=1 Tax=Ramlibacter tataouinensis (strain ATCC BAA-407 / DSM 14655 / LMG 21543 / TTB310) TaxID=365046 RepID=F5XY50_RAMTT|nr:hypothetical protein Rta_32630 [Ramlibacter tataouinensis TTB310]